MSHNYSLYSIPAYYVLAMVPHVYSAVLVGIHKQSWDNSASRSKKFDESLRKGLPPKVYATFERCRAAHNNMLSENMAFFVGGVLAGNMAGLNTDFMNKTIGWYLASRVGYLVCYIGIERKRYSYVRTMAFIGGISILFRIYYEAGKAMAGKVSL